MGCWDSHRRLFNKIKEENIEYTLIMEDDVDLVENFQERLNDVISELPDDWDLLYLGGWNVGDIIKYSDKLNLAKKVYTTHAFIVRQKFVDTVIKGINERQWKVDVLISDILPLGNCFICNPTLAWQREGFSDIENRETNNLLDEARNAIYRLKHQWHHLDILHLIDTLAYRQKRYSSSKVLH
jgi:GR25 family glycosyltransferase involved in LPS biosynthesis